MTCSQRCRPASRIPVKQKKSVPVCFNRPLRTYLKEGNQAGQEKPNIAQVRLFSCNNAVSDRLDQPNGSTITHLQGGLVRQSVPGNSLRLHSLLESDERRQDGDPGQSSEHGDRRDEVVEDLKGVCRSDEVGETHKTSSKDESDIGDTSLGASSKDLGGVSVTSHTVEGSRSDVLIRVGGREGEEEKTSVDDMGKSTDTGGCD